MLKPSSLVLFFLVVWGIGLPPAIAQLLYPPVGGDRGISVTGQGRASVPADRAQIDIWLTNTDPYAVQPYELPPEAAYTVPSPPPITRASLQPVVEALTATGLSSAAIDILIPPVDDLPYSYPPLSTSIQISLDDPTQSRVNELVQLVNETLQNQTPAPTIFLDQVYVQYAIDSCDAVEQQAYTAALQDARLRAEAIAQAIDVTLSDPPSIAELPFIGRFLSPCNEDTDIIGSLFWNPNDTTFNPTAPAEVEVFREVLVTYPVED